MVSAARPVFSPRRRQVEGGRPLLVRPDLTPGRARDLAAVAKALGHPARLQIIDVIRKAAPEAVCQIELVPLFDMSQPALAKHLNVLVGSGILESQRLGAWTYYYARPGGLEALASWLG